MQNHPQKTIPIPNPTRANQLPAALPAAAPSDVVALFSSVNDFVGSLEDADFLVSNSSSSISLICAGVAAAGPGVVQVAGTFVSPASYALAVAHISALDN
jgi:hypothetical protein